MTSRTDEDRELNLRVSTLIMRGLSATEAAAQASAERDACRADGTARKARKPGPNVCDWCAHHGTADRPVTRRASRFVFGRFHDSCWNRALEGSGHTESEKTALRVAV